MNARRSTTRSLLLVAMALATLAGCADTGHVASPVGMPGDTTDVVAAPAGDDLEGDGSVQTAESSLFGPAPRPPDPTAVAACRSGADLILPLDAAGSGTASALRGDLCDETEAFAVAADETGRFLYVAENDPDAGRGVLHVIDIADRTQPSVTHSIQLAYGAPLKDIEVDAAEQRLYLAATTYVHVFDLTDPAEPQAVGRLYDYMVRNYDEVSVDRVSDPQFGYRSFLTIRARLGGGDGCPTGFAYTYDITGDLFERPLMIANSEIPRMADHGRTDPVDPAFGECPELSLSLNNETFRMEVSWLVEETSGWTPLRRDHFPYNITARFREQADYCILVPV